MIAYLKMLRLVLFHTCSCGQVHRGFYAITAIERVVKKGAIVSIHERLALLRLELAAVIPPDALDVKYAEALVL